MIMTTSEARAEACTIVLKLLLSRLPATELRRVMAASIVEVDRIGSKPISEELEWLFHDLKL